jgi:site-specific DNA-methyltransferase (adenine-specific)
VKAFYEDPLTKIYCGDMREILFDLGQVANLTVTSPPYNASKKYEEDLSSKAYAEFLRSCFYTISMASKKKGRLALNVPFSMRKKTYGEIVILPIVFECLRGLFKVKDQIIWDQMNPDNDTSWGSFGSPSSPYIRHQCEYIVLAYKDEWRRYRARYKGTRTIDSVLFTRLTLDLWRFTPNQGPKIHPAQFPLDLPARCITMFSYPDDTILDPFMGKGTTLVAAKNAGRKSIGIDISEEYCEMAANEVRQEILQLPKGSVI